MSRNLKALYIFVTALLIMFGYFFNFKCLKSMTNIQHSEFIVNLGAVVAVIVW